jgi:hypothetical protein
MNDPMIDNDNATKLVQIIKSRITSRDDFRKGNSKVLLDQEEIKNRLQHAAQSKPYQLLAEVANAPFSDRTNTVGRIWKPSEQKKQNRRVQKNYAAVCTSTSTWTSLLVRQDLGRLMIEDIVELGDDYSSEILLVVLVESTNCRQVPKSFEDKAKQQGYEYKLIQDGCKYYQIPCRIVLNSISVSDGILVSGGYLKLQYKSTTTHVTLSTIEISNSKVRLYGYRDTVVKQKAFWECFKVYIILLLRRPQAL